MRLRKCDELVLFMTPKHSKVNEPAPKRTQILPNYTKPIIHASIFNAAKAIKTDTKSITSHSLPHKFAKL